ncbi:hypothetical protein ACFQI7_06545 [Paenibacillus allorhizosphaerae]|uniref:CopG family transcriptional regulator n=1 Tax=Paenibacillus allorhizosphaerae TaxID=2849866 RepID=A0ABN7TJ10_9BACL|nr:hypothetical protein [Paenibacillus allorhizosphaerae]CAG7635326.1 hypothetical protein PAECIP111802_02127 [Paenibacillus allorhizosphaerae]
MKLGIPYDEGQLQMLFTRGGPRRGAGRKSTGETRKISLTMTREAWVELERRCDAAGVSKSELLRSLIEPALFANPAPDAGE